MIQKVVSLAFVYVALLAGVEASKDDSYYKAGSGNPNIYQKMYWKDADNILQDLSKFQTLYVQFQHCAWTWMNYGDDADEGSVDENDYWYMGKVPPFGANVAFSLYGSLAGESFKGCNADSFINSFYTRTGFSEFVYAMSYAGVSPFTYYDFSGYTSDCQGYYGVGCDYSNGFAMHEYSTQECNPKYFTGVSDKMQFFNQAMQNAQCVKIYDASSGRNWNGYNYTVYGTPLELLAYSQACFYQNYWSPDGECPDPYNKIQFYQQNFNRGVVKSKRSDPFEQYTVQMAESKRLAGLGTFMLVAAAIVLAIGFFVPAIKPKIVAIKKKIPAMKQRMPDIKKRFPWRRDKNDTSTQNSVGFVAPELSVSNRPPSTDVNAENVERSINDESDSTPAPPTHQKKMFRAMFGKD